VLIGTTTNNGARLSVSGNTYLSSDLRFGTDFAGSNTAIIKWQGSGASIANSLGLFTWGDARDIQIGGKDVYFGAEGATPRMLITSGGNVLIGQTLDLGYKFLVFGTGLFSSTLLVAAGNNGGRLRVGNITNAYAIAFEKSNSSLTLGGFYQNSGSSGEMILIDTNGNQNVLISSSNNSYFNASGGNVLIGTTTNSGDRLRVNGTTFSNDIMTWNPANDNRSGVAWRLGAASIGTDIPNRRLRVNVGGVEYYIAAVEV
jgi:hypothetical protein